MTQEKFAYFYMIPLIENNVILLFQTLQLRQSGQITNDI